MWDTAGHVVTNYHCIERLATDRTGQQGTRVGILTPSGDTLELIASIVGTGACICLALSTERVPPLVLVRATDCPLLPCASRPIQ